MRFVYHCCTVAWVQDVVSYTLMMDGTAEASAWRLASHFLQKMYDLAISPAPWLQYLVISCGYCCSSASELVILISVFSTSNQGLGRFSHRFQIPSGAIGLGWRWVVDMAKREPLWKMSLSIYPAGTYKYLQMMIWTLYTVALISYIPLSAASTGSNV